MCENRWRELRAHLESQKSKRYFKLFLPIDAEGKPSVTLLTAYVSFIVAEIAILKCLQDDDVKIYAMIAAVGVFMYSMIMMRLRRLDSAELDIDDMSIKLNSKGKSDDVHTAKADDNRSSKIN